MSKFNGKTVLTFDCYGTLIDWETGLVEALRPLRENGASAEEILEAYGPIEHEIEVEQPGLPYSQLLERVHERLSDRFGVEPDEVEAAKFGASVGDWPAFPDTAEALRYLKQHFKLIILSNVDMAADDSGPICQDTGMPTFVIHTPVGVNQIAIKKAIRAKVLESYRNGQAAGPRQQGVRRVAKPILGTESPIPRRRAVFYYA